MTHYSLQAIDKLINRYIEKGGEVTELVEGSLGHGTTILWGFDLKTAVIQEKYLNEWSSTHTVRMYKDMPKKYQLMLKKQLS